MPRLISTNPAALATGGLRPSEGDPRSHQQVVYAVAMAVIERFEQFLGRRFRWRAEEVLRLMPHAFEGRNAFFDPTRRAVLFGYYRADLADPGANLPGQMIFTCLSSDIVAHEVTHALLHRLRPLFSEATNPDVFAWHEACADLIALFQHLAYPELVATAVADADGDLRRRAAVVGAVLEHPEVAVGEVAAGGGVAVVAVAAPVVVGVRARRGGQSAKAHRYPTWPRRVLRTTVG